MSDQNSHAAGEEEHRVPTAAEKGKGKAVEPLEDTSMGDDDDDDESSSEDEAQEGGEAEEDADPEDEDNMEEIDADNIISDGRRTRGKNIDFTKTEQEEGDDLDEDEDDDDDFEDPDDQMHD